LLRLGGAVFEEAVEGVVAAEQGVDDRHNVVSLVNGCEKFRKRHLFVAGMSSSCECRLLPAFPWQGDASGLLFRVR
jgi:hypothetical protein